MSSVIEAGGRAQLSQNSATIAAIMRAISILDGAFSSRDMVGCEHSGAPVCGGAADRHLEDRIVAQGIAVVGVLKTGRDREHACLEHLDHRVVELRRIAPVGDACGEPLGDAERALDLAQQQHAGVRRQPAAVEGKRHLLTRNRWQFEGKQAIFVHGGCGAP